MTTTTDPHGGKGIEFRWADVLIGGNVAASPLNAADLPAPFAGPVAHLTIWGKPYMMSAMLGETVTPTVRLPSLLVGVDAAAAIIAQLQHAAAHAGWIGQLDERVTKHRADLAAFTAAAGPLYGLVLDADHAEGTGP